MLRLCGVGDEFEADKSMNTDYTGCWKLLYDWQTLVAGFLALAAGALAYSVGQRQVGASKSALQAESIISLMEKFDSEAFQNKRRLAAEACLSKLPTRESGVDVDDVLDLFEDAAFLVHEGALSRRMMWHGFHHWVRIYYQASERYIADCRENEPARWKYLCLVYPLLNEVEKAEGKGKYIERLTDAALRTQLEEELPPPPKVNP
jgi:hypothetical protein